MNFKTWITEANFYQGNRYAKTLDAIHAVYSSHPDPRNVVCTFTQINKVGLNPSSRHTTPLGIYSYPISYVLRTRMHVPYAGRSRYVNICEFTSPENILHMEHDGEQNGLELLRVFPDYESIIDKVKQKYTLYSNYSVLWLATKELAEDDPIQWNKLLRQIGVHGFVDHNTGTIHISEPVQSVVFTKLELKHLVTFDNRVQISKPLFQ